MNRYEQQAGLPNNLLLTFVNRERETDGEDAGDSGDVEEVL